MRVSIILACLGIVGCGGDWRADAMSNAETIVRQHLGDPSLRFIDVQFTGDNATGQTCGYYQKPGAHSATRFIVFIDGAGGQNPFIDDPAAVFPRHKADFALNWRTQCRDLGYTG